MNLHPPGDAPPLSGPPMQTPGPLELRPGAVPLVGSRFATALLRLLGWQVHCQGLPAAQGVMIVYPHTSNWDFPVAVLAKWATGMPLTWWVKESLFGWPLFGRWLRSMGAIPVRRGARLGIAAQMAGNLAEARREGRFLWLGLSPEGTRQHGAGWHSSFHRMAWQADVPLGLVLLDFGRREVRFERFWRLSGDTAEAMDADMAAIAQACAGVQGCRPGQASPVRLVPHPPEKNTRGDP